MGIHSMRTRFNGRLFDVWKIDENTSNIVSFYNAVKEDLPEHDDLYIIDVTAYIRGGEHVVKVTSDRTLMHMFNLNTNPTDVVLLEVERVKCVPLNILPPLMPEGPSNVNDGNDNEFGEDTASEGNAGDDEHDDNDNDDELEDEGVEEELQDNANDDGAEDVMVEDELESDDDEVSDPNWKYGRDYSEEDVSSESVSDIIMHSDDAEWTDLEDYDTMGKQKRREHDDQIDPNSNIPDASSHIGPDGKIKFQLFQVYDDYKSFGDVLLDYCVQEGFEIKKKKFDRNRVTAICRIDECPWRIHASLSPDGLSFIIKTYSEEHTCQAVKKNRTANAAWIAQKLFNLLKYEPTMKIDAMRGYLLDKYGIDVANHTLWKARVKAKEMIHGSHRESFSKLRCYAEMVLRTNPGSMAIVQSDVVSPPDGNMEGVNGNLPAPVFKRIFICYAAAKMGFVEGCRPFIGLDGCHLKGPYKGILLSAVGVDANLKFFPIAYAIAETENVDVWKWFIDLLKIAIGENFNGIPWTVMSDRQKGIVDAMPDMPGSAHRFCAWHLWQNFHKKFAGAEFKNMFWKAANTANFNEFVNVMAEIKRLNVQAYEYLMAIDAKHWSRCKFQHTSKVDLNTNNHTESFNSWLNGIRHFPPIQLLEKLRERHSGLLYTRHVIGERYNGKLPPKVRHVIRELTRKSRSAIVRRCGEYEFEVEMDEYKGTTKLDDKHCACEMWQLSGLPCPHALACINTIRAELEDYVHPFYYVDKWRKCYSRVIHSIPSINLWPQFEGYDLQPPVVRTLPGRPKKHRRRAQGEPRPSSHMQSSTKRCGICNEFGHNRRSCSQTPARKGRSRPPGRPSKTPRTETEAASSSSVRGRGRGMHGRRVASHGRSRQPSNDANLTTPQGNIQAEEVVPTQNIFCTQDSHNE